MAESLSGGSRIAKFKAKKEIFDTIASTIVCSKCEIVPRETPIYETDKGLILCAACKPSSKLTGIYQSLRMEKLLMALPTSCKFKKNHCPVVQDRNNILYHEEDCEFRDVICPFQYCTKMVSVNHLVMHLRNFHNLDILKNGYGITSSRNGSYNVVRQYYKTKYLESKVPLRLTNVIPYELDKTLKTFMLQVQNYPEFTMMRLQLFGSKFEAQCFKYSIKIEDPKLGIFSYEGHVLSLDDNADLLFRDGPGLVLNNGLVKSLIQNNHLTYVIEIFDLKKENEVTDSLVSEDGI